MLKAIARWYGYIASVILLITLVAAYYQQINTLVLWVCIATTGLGLKWSNYYLVYSARKDYLSKLISE